MLVSHVALVHQCLGVIFAANVGEPRCSDVGGSNGGTPKWLGVSPFEISSMKWYEDLGSSGRYIYMNMHIICIHSHLKFATAEELSLRIPSAEIGTQSVFSEKLFRLDPKAFRVTASGSITAPLASWDILKF